MIKTLLLTILLYASVVSGAEYTLEPSGGDDTLNFETAFTAANASNDTINIIPGSYTITDSMPPITQPLVIKSGGRAVINLVNVGQFIEVEARNVEIRNIHIQGDDNSNGILAHDGSWLTLTNITFIDLKVALELDYQHDSDFNKIGFYSNGIDLLAEKRQITSIKIKNSHFELSDYAFKINASSTDLVFRDNGFAPIGTDNPLQITNATFKGLFTGNRVELKALANGLYIQGQSHSFPAQTFTITDNYFTGKIINAIYLDSYTNNNTVKNNHFQVDPTVSDITNKSPFNIMLENNHPSIHLNRSLIYIFDTGN